MDELNEEFTQEELVTLGEADEEQESSESEEAAGEATEEEETEESTESEESEEEENMVPQSRVNQIVAKQKQAQEKLDLLRSDPDKYYETYPDEKPEEKEEKSLTHTGFQDYGSMVVQGGKWDGKTLNEVYEDSPADANALLFDYKESLREAERTEKETAKRIREKSEAEINDFSSQVAKELFEKGVDDLDEKEGKRIDDIIETTLDWMNEENGKGRGIGTIQDAYFLMHKDDILSAAQLKGADGLIKQLSSSGVKNVKGTKTEGKKTGYEGYEAMSAEQLDIAIENMTDAEVERFLKNAPASLKAKYPAVDWD